jgi:endonuclease VIII
MVEAPRIRILYEQIKFTKGKKIIHASGTSYTKYNIDLTGYLIRKWWYAGKYLYVYLKQKNMKSYVVRTHMMMYGKIIINDNPQVNPKLTPFMIWILNDHTKLTWYLSQIIVLDPDCDSDIIKSNYAQCYSSIQSIKDSIDMMQYDISNASFNKNNMIKRIQNYWTEVENDILTDFLLNQKFFPGVGNILQQEALYRCRILPIKKVSQINIPVIESLIDALKDVINLLYKSYQDKLHNLPHKPILQIYNKKFCPMGHKTITQYIGVRNRKTTWCRICQI